VGRIMEKNYKSNKGNEMYFFITRLGQVDTINPHRAGVSRKNNAGELWPYSEILYLEPNDKGVFPPKLKGEVCFSAKWHYNNGQKNFWMGH